MAHAAKTPARPLSPHLQVYRLPLAAWLSITHRATGVGLSIGLLLMVWWIVSAAYGAESYEQAVTFLASPIGLLLLLGFSVSLFFHLCNGIRHLLWDTGRGLSIAGTKRGNLLVLIGAVVLTVATWALALL